jgi:hypothetical protein
VFDQGGELIVAKIGAARRYYLLGFVAFIEKSRAAAVGTRSGP